MKYCKIFTLSLITLFCLQVDVSAQCTYPSGTDIIKGSTFDGSFNSGTSSDPDVVCPGRKIVYELKPPTGFTNAQFGTAWVITSLSFETAYGTAAKDTVLVLPSAATGNGRLMFTPRSSLADSTFILIASVRSLTSSCDTVLTRFVHVSAVPDAGFLPSSNFICLGEVISFSDNSSGSGLSRLWDFGDGSKSTATSPNYAYTSEGTYKVWLKVTNSNGCVDSTDETIIVSPYPNPNFTISDISACVGQEITFTNTSTDTDLPSYEYKFGDDSTATTENAKHTYTSPGTYDVWLIIANGPGCTDSVKKQITVSARPSVAFTGTDVCLGTLTTFTNTSSSGTGITYEWRFGDGQTSTDQNPTHTYSTADTFTAWLYVTGPGGCTDSLSDTVIVFDVEADFQMSVAAGCSPVAVNFTNTTSDSLISYLWVFGDGDSSTNQDPLHEFTTPGVYEVTLYVISSDGCEDSATQEVRVFTDPKSSFTWDTAFLSATFTPDEGGHAAYTWSFGDGDSSTAQNPTHEYDSAGTYHVTLQVTSANGCRTEWSDSVTVTEDTSGNNGVFENHSLAVNLSVYPNPFSEDVNVSFELRKSSRITILIYDMEGRRVYSEDEGNLPVGKYSILLKKKLASGTYNLQLVTDSTAVNRQIIRVER